MAKRFGRNQKRKMLEQVLHAQEAALHAQNLADRANNELNRVLRDQLSKGVIPLEVEHFLSCERRSVIMHAIFDERRLNLHYRHELSPKELMLQRDRGAREELGRYLGRAIADRIAEAYAGKVEGNSKAA